MNNVNNANIANNRGFALDFKKVKEVISKRQKRSRNIDKYSARETVVQMLSNFGENVQNNQQNQGDNINQIALELFKNDSRIFKVTLPRSSYPVLMAEYLRHIIHKLSNFTIKNAKNDDELVNVCKLLCKIKISDGKFDIKHLFGTEFKKFVCEKLKIKDSEIKDEIISEVLEGGGNFSKERAILSSALNKLSSNPLTVRAIRIPSLALVARVVVVINKNKDNLQVENFAEIRDNETDLNLEGTGLTKDTLLNITKNFFRYSSTIFSLSDSIAKAKDKLFTVRDSFKNGGVNLIKKQIRESLKKKLSREFFGVDNFLSKKFDLTNNIKTPFRNGLQLMLKSELKENEFNAFIDKVIELRSVVMQRFDEGDLLKDWNNQLKNIYVSPANTSMLELGAHSKYFVKSSQDGLYKIDNLSIIADIFSNNGGDSFDDLGNNGNNVNFFEDKEFEITKKIERAIDLHSKWLVTINDGENAVTKVVGDLSKTDEDIKSKLDNIVSIQDKFLENADLLYKSFYDDRRTGFQKDARKVLNLNGFLGHLKLIESEKIILDVIKSSDNNKNQTIKNIDKMFGSGTSAKLIQAYKDNIFTDDFNDFYKFVHHKVYRNDRLGNFDQHVKENLLALDEAGKQKVFRPRYAIAYLFKQLAYLSSKKEFNREDINRCHKIIAIFNLGKGSILKGPESLNISLGSIEDEIADINSGPLYWYFSNFWTGIKNIFRSSRGMHIKNINTAIPNFLSDIDTMKNHVSKINFIPKNLKLTKNQV